MLLRNIKKIHFVGIGGAGMSAIAKVMLALGFEVSGSDISKSEITTIQYAFFPFLFGIYPYAFPTEKQLEAMKREGFEHKNVTISKLVEQLLKSVLD